MQVRHIQLPQIIADLKNVAINLSEDQKSPNPIFKKLEFQLKKLDENMDKHFTIAAKNLLAEEQKTISNIDDFFKTYKSQLNEIIDTMNGLQKTTRKSDCTKANLERIISDLKAFNNTIPTEFHYANEFSFIYNICKSLGGISLKLAQTALPTLGLEEKQHNIHCVSLKKLPIGKKIPSAPVYLYIPESDHSIQDGGLYFIPDPETPVSFDHLKINNRSHPKEIELLTHFFNSDLSSRSNQILQQEEQDFFAKLLGSQFQANTQKENIQGICAGMVFEWAHQSIHFGTPYYPITSTIKVIEKQNKQNLHSNNSYQLVMQGQLRNADFIDVFSKLPLNIPYYFAIRPNEGYGHAIGVRRHAKHIEIFDPNLGCLFFPTIENAAIGLTNIFLEYHLSGFIVENWKLYKNITKSSDDILNSEFPSASEISDSSAHGMTVNAYNTFIQLTIEKLEAAIKTIKNPDQLIDLLLLTLTTIQSSLTQKDQLDIREILTTALAVCENETKVERSATEFASLQAVLNERLLSSPILRLTIALRKEDILKAIARFDENENTNRQFLSEETSAMYKQAKGLEQSIIQQIYSLCTDLNEVNIKLAEHTLNKDEVTRLKTIAINHENKIKNLNAKRSYLRKLAIPKKLIAAHNGKINYNIKQAQSDLKKFEKSESKVNHVIPLKKSPNASKKLFPSWNSLNLFEKALIINLAVGVLLTGIGGIGILAGFSAFAAYATAAHVIPVIASAGSAGFVAFASVASGMLYSLTSIVIKKCRNYFQLSNPNQKMNTSSSAKTSKPSSGASIRQGLFTNPLLITNQCNLLPKNSDLSSKIENTSANSAPAFVGATITESDFTNRSVQGQCFRIN